MSDRGDHLLGDGCGDNDGEVGRLLLGVETSLGLLTGSAKVRLFLIR